MLESFFIDKNILMLLIMPIISPVLLCYILLSFILFCNVQDEVLWFEFQPREDHAPSEIAMNNWLEAPAGKHGFLQMDGKDLAFEDGTPIKFWGVNISSGRAYTEKKQADQWVKHLSKYGVNAVRFHKFTWHGYKEGYSTVLDDKKYQNFDYFNHALREKGIYYGWSHIYGHRVKATDKEKLIAYNEIASLNYPWSHLNGTTSSLINFAEDLQNLNIELTVGMLEHVNPHTGLRYADDPALIFIELQNEDNIFWGAIEKALEQAPTYRALLCKQFSNWLKAKYGTKNKLVEAWGEGNLPEGQSLDKKNIYPTPNHGLFSGKYLEAQKAGRPIEQHIADKMHFLFEKQSEFYTRFEKAIRDTGYKGVIVGSCWQAGMGPSHYYNIYADYQIGMIDRHNYWGGGTGHHLKEGKVKNRAMLSRPGLGILSTGMQQVSDRPFSISEWMNLLPNEWTAEGVPIVGLYGMGLQGWDASFHFGSDHPHYTNTLHTPGVYNVESPLQMAFYPSIARMVYRNDVQEGETISTRNVHIPSLAEGKLGFLETIEQGYDDKFITGDAPAELMAAGKVAVQFSDAYKDYEPTDVSDYWDEENKWVKSNTGELFWDYSEKGYITANTPNSKAVVGFTGNKKIELGDITIKTPNEFACILITALEKDKSIENSKKILITTISRAKNSGMVYNEDQSKVLEVGEAPILMEAVNVNITLSKKITVNCKVQILDHVGRKTGNFVEISENQIQLKGSETKAFYYLIEVGK